MTTLARLAGTDGSLASVARRPCQWLRCHARDEASTFRPRRRYMTRRRHRLPAFTLLLTMMPLEELVSRVLRITF
jgi:hypothetical protein